MPQSLTPRAKDKQHVAEVRKNLSDVVFNLQRRAWNHDASKFEEPERSQIDKMAEELDMADTTYGSPEYKAILKKYEGFTKHHYEVCDHHPEHFPITGYFGMNLLQKLEMLADWYAATKRMKNGDLRRSIIQNAERFGYDEWETASLLSTAQELGWISYDGGVQAVPGGDAGTAGSEPEPESQQKG